MNVISILQDACFNCGLIDEADKEIPEEYEYTASKYFVNIVNSINDDPSTELNTWPKTFNVGNTLEKVLRVPSTEGHKFIGMNLGLTATEGEVDDYAFDDNFALKANTNPYEWLAVDYDTIPRVVRIERILDHEGKEVTFVKPHEFNGEFKGDKEVFTYMETPDAIILKFHKEGEYTMYFGMPLILCHDVCGYPTTLQAKDSFKSYITNLLAYRLAVHYGLASATAMKAVCDEDLNLVNKHPNKRRTPVNVEKRIAHTLRNRSRIFVR